MDRRRLQHLGRSPRRRYNGNGSPQGDLLQNSAPGFSGKSEYGGLAIDDAGNFAVAKTRIDVFAYDADNTASGTYTSPVPRFDAVDLAMNNAGHLVAVSASGGQIFAQRLSETTLRVTGVSTAQGELLEPGQMATGAVAGLVARFSQGVNDVVPAIGSVLNLANWQLLRNGQDWTGQIVGLSYAEDRVTLALAGELPTGAYTLTARDAIQSLASDALDGDGNGITGGDFHFAFQVSPLRPVGSQSTLGDPNTPGQVVVAANIWGLSLAVRNAPAAGGTTATLVQRYSISGALQGPPQMLGTMGVQPVTLLAVGMDGQTGFVLFYREGSSAVFAQRFDPAGGRIGAPDFPPPGRERICRFGLWRVCRNYLDPTDGLSAERPITVDSAPFVRHPGGTPDERGVYQGAGVARRLERLSERPANSRQNFDLSGLPIDEPFTVAEVPSYVQEQAPTIGINPDGGFVVAWQQSGWPTFPPVSPGSNVYARVYDSSAQPLTDIFQVNTDRFEPPSSDPFSSVPSPLTPPAVAFDGSGHFVITWQSVAGDGMNSGLFSRGFLNDGTPLDDAQRVNLNSTGYQVAPSAAWNGQNHVMLGWNGPATHLQRFEIGSVPIVDLNGSTLGVDFEHELNFLTTQVTLIDPSLLEIKDAGDTPLTSAVVTLENPLGGDLLSVDTSGTGISASFMGTFLMLTGTDSAANYQQVLRTLAYIPGLQARPASSTIEISFLLSSADQQGPTSTARTTNYVPGSSFIYRRYLFYNNSQFDPGDDNRAAIAWDKSRYRADSGPAQPHHISSYTRGINGIIIDLGGDHGTLTPDDFQIRVGTNDDPDTWAVGPAPSEVLVRSDLGESGSDSVELIWPDGAIKNTWLEVTFKANGNTGLAVPDVFYFGSRVGDTGTGTPVAAITNSTDEVSIRNNMGAGADIGNLFDVDRNGIVQMADAVAARNNAGFLRYINIVSPAVQAQTAEVLTMTSAGLASEFVGPLAGSLGPIAQALAAPKFATGEISPWLESQQPVSTPAVAALAPQLVTAAFATWEHAESETPMGPFGTEPDPAMVEAFDQLVRVWPHGLRTGLR